MPALPIRSPTASAVSSTRAGSRCSAFMRRSLHHPGGGARSSPSCHCGWQAGFCALGLLLLPLWLVRHRGARLAPATLAGDRVSPRIVPRGRGGARDPARRVLAVDHQRSALADPAYRCLPRSARTSPEPRHARRLHRRHTPLRKSSWPVSSSPSPSESARTCSRVTMAMPSDHRLHPSSVLFALAGSLRAFLVPAVVLILTSGRSSPQPSGPGGWGPARWMNRWMPGDFEIANWQFWILLFLIPSTIVALVRYFTFRLRYEGTELVIRSGILFRNERHVPYARIQNLDAVRNVVHRLLGVAVVRVETGGGQAPEATISVLHETVFEEMRRRSLRRTRARCRSRNRSHRRRRRRQRPRPNLGAAARSTKAAGRCSICPCASCC